LAGENIFEEKHEPNIYSPVKASVKKLNLDLYAVFRTYEKKDKRV
jgi:hypothetical protein